MQTWVVANKSIKNFKTGHPWVFANEMLGNLKSVQPGEIVQLCDEKKRFLAYGYGNPHSRIAFRELSRDKNFNSDTSNLVAERLLVAAEQRAKLGYEYCSHRLCFSEGDRLPGLIIDCFFTDDRQIFVLQILTAGMEKLIKNIEQTITTFLILALQKKLPYRDMSKTTLVIKRDSNSRQQEVLEVFPPQTVNPAVGLNLNDCAVKIQSAADKSKHLNLCADFIKGQKTGMFLDQAANIEIVVKHLPKDRPLKILDLFSYVGQWGAQLANANGLRETEVTLVDASAAALQMADKNAAQFSDHVKTLKLDIVNKCDQLPVNYYDIVICDPPALIKAKKDFANGSRAYQKVNRYALRALKAGGLLMSCSCSQPLSLKDLRQSVQSAAIKESRKLEILQEGAQSLDHPSFKGFPQGFYLKSVLYKSHL